ncbi:hypothetical protein IW261DRAFT_1553871 [Armillaria novae-zelandiae]|uniref:DUF6589 domain-containing protein n=1 Tax=Armillaria novae-zelandiae TaxID=153914 RepID=A0AA39NL40_9AGAR|nr:hypothetical protein IW261DRAFT_1553871 [Armillaria novae-zelandiae]
MTSLMPGIISSVSCDESSEEEEGFYIDPPHFPWLQQNHADADNADLLNLIAAASNGFEVDSDTPSLRQTPLSPLVYSEGFMPSSPVTGTCTEQITKNRQKGQKKRWKTIELKKAMDTEPIDITGTVLEAVLDILQENQLTIGDLMFYVFDPEYAQTAKWTGFFHSGHVGDLLDMWVGHGNSSSGCWQVHDWAVNYICHVTKAEATTVTRQGLLQTTGHVMDAIFFKNFSFARLYNYLNVPSAALVTLKILTAFLTSPRSLTSGTPAHQTKINTTITSASLQCLGAFSQCNNLAKRVIGLYLYATGSQCQPITLLSCLGMSESYPSIVTTDDRKEGKHQFRTGTLLKLSGFMRGGTRAMASTGLFAASYDNINIAARSAEQIIGRNAMQENGTCMTLFPLWKASLNDMHVTDLETSFDCVPPLDITDILHTPEESDLFQRCLNHCILRILIMHGGSTFQQFKSKLAEMQPESDIRIDAHKTKLFPCPTWPIDELTIIGNIHVIDAIIDETAWKNHADFLSFAKFLAGDQLSIARLQAIFNIWSGKEGGYTGYGWCVLVPGLFHAKIADSHGFLTMHWGKPNARARNPSSLSFHNMVLNRLPIVLTSLPTFRVSRDLIFISLYSQVLHYFLLILRKKTLAQYSSSVETWDELVAHATQIQDTFLDINQVEELHDERKANIDGKAGDMVYENTAGDSGRIILVLKIWALSYRGSGRTKYAYEMLHIIHNITHVWPKGIRDIVLQNWLVNMTGQLNAFIEVDLMQEHMNFWIKNFYKAHGSNSLNSVLGTNQEARHCPPDLSKDIAAIMKSLKEHKVYTIKRGQILHSDDPPTKDIISVSLKELTDSTSNPLRDYNKEFGRLQAMQHLIPVVIDPTDLAVHATDVIRLEIGVEDESTSLQNNCLLDSDSEADLSEDEWEERAEKGELEHLLENEDELTLGHETSDDVSLNMDGDEEEDQDTIDIDELQSDPDDSEME